MDLKKVALVLLFGGSVAMGAVACGGGGGGGTTGTTGTPVPEDTGVTRCDVNADTDTGTATFQIRHLGLPSPSSGFNVDGYNNDPSHGGRTVGSCGVPDAPGGIDNGLAGIAKALSSVIDISSALQDALVHQVADGGTEGSLQVSVTLNHLAANNAANDSCIGVDVNIAGAGAPLQFSGSGNLTNNVANLLFTDTLVFNVTLPVPAASCPNGCSPATISIAVRGGRARLSLDATHTTITATNSLIGGFVFNHDDDPSYATLNQTGFKTALESFASDAGLDPNLISTATSAFESSEDLHMTTSETLVPCTSPNNSVSNVNANAVSVALKIDSVATP